MWWAQLLNNVVALLGVGGSAATSYESISTVTVGAGGSSSVTFSSIPSTYKHLQIRYIGRTTVASTGSDDIAITLNGSSASYAWHRLIGDGATAAAGAASSTTQIFLSGAVPRGNATASIYGAGVIDILDYTDTNKNKTTRALFGNDQNGSGQVLLSSGLWYATPAAVTSVTLTPESSHTFAQYSQFALYGVKG
jgi:hypothetical protein